MKPDILSNLYEELGDGQALAICTRPDGAVAVVRLDSSSLQAIADSGRTAIVVGMMGLPGVRYCLHHLEYTYFEPNTPRARDFTVLMIKWQRVQWFGAVIPSEEAAAVDVSAEKSGLVTRRGVAPVSIAAKGCVPFPVIGDAVLFLESEPGSRAHDGPGAVQEMLVDENWRMEQDFGGGERS